MALLPGGKNLKDSKIRLQKFIAESGYTSRRKAEELIAAGRVKINGKLAVIGDKVDPKKDKVYINGKRVIQDKRLIYLMLNKPRGYVTTMDDELGRKCVASLVADCGARVFPVGRLDKDSEGLLIMTNDGEFANKIMHPSQKISKTYRVTVKGKATDEQIEGLEGITVVDGKIISNAEIRIITRDDGRTVLQFVIHEGKNRQIRKMCEAVGLEVIRLKRTHIGKVKLGMLKIGDYRPLNEKEIKYLSGKGGSDNNF